MENWKSDHQIAYIATQMHAKFHFTDFWSSVDLPQCKIINSHKLYKVMIFIIIMINNLDRLQETEEYPGKTFYKENFIK